MGCYVHSIVFYATMALLKYIASKQVIGLPATLLKAKKPTRYGRLQKISFAYRKLVQLGLHILDGFLNQTLSHRCTHLCRKNRLGGCDGDRYSFVTHFTFCARLSEAICSSAAAKRRLTVTSRAARAFQLQLQPLYARFQRSAPLALRFLSDAAHSANTSFFT